MNTSVQRAADLKISVTTNDGKTYDARFVTSAPEADLAFIKIESKEPLAFVNLDDLSPNLLGQSVLVLGNPLGYGSSVARGILSAKGRAVTVRTRITKTSSRPMQPSIRAIPVGRSWI
jgi:S1-C subfamily serine protease